MAEMTKKEFLELLNEFSEKTLDPKFRQIDSRFEQVDKKLGEIDRRFEKVDSRFTEFRGDITHQFHIISEDVISKVKLVAEGVAILNEKLDRHIDEDKREHKDILAAIKFSYAELDRRITTLEAEMEDLKRRMDKIERRSVS
jgi:chromosome segregation ATPase